MDALDSPLDDSLWLGGFVLFAVNAVSAVVVAANRILAALGSVAAISAWNDSCSYGCNYGASRSNGGGPESDFLPRAKSGHVPSK
ncbi:hypothetical protein [Streptomyces sp. NPDC087437]|uniref:hypothetical protein n=1 Tax=Streptomyces sp. NPDC087437 TaxID=3365789 RepID=UPI0037F5063A